MEMIVGTLVYSRFNLRLQGDSSPLAASPFNDLFADDLSCTLKRSFPG